MKIVKRLTAYIIGVAFIVSCMPELNAYAGEALTGKTSMEIVGMMGKGYNLGNTFDATGGNAADPLSQETSWGNPRVTKELIDGVKAAGFTTIRIPVTWGKYVSLDGNYTINEGFLNRVKEVVDWAIEDDLFVIINMHHEGWLNKATLADDYIAIGEELKGIWRQVSDTFADYDQHLIFEGMNEPRAAGTGYEWTGNEDCYKAVNYLNDIFVNTVRNNGKGHNGERALMIPGYAASSSEQVLNSIVIPDYNGTQAGNIIVSVHCYSPYEFCLTDQAKTFDPKKSADTADITRLMSSLKRLFIDNGIPVVIGECGCTNSGDNLEERLEWFDFFGTATRNAGIPAIVWDNGAGGNSGGECHRYINRKTGEQVAPTLITAFIYGKDEIPGEAVDRFIDFEPFENSAGETDICSPQTVGFTNIKIFKEAKVNHTPDAVIGFSLKVTDDVKNNTALLDMGDYQGEKITVSGYVSARDTTSVEIGSMSGDKATALTTVECTSEWTAFQCVYEVTDKHEELYFKGKPGEVFYVDDISILVGDHSGGGTENASEDTEETGNTEEAGNTEGSDATERTDDSALLTDEGVNEENLTENDGAQRRAGSQALFLLGAGVLAFALVYALKISRKKK